MLECRDIVEHQILWKPRMGSSLFWYDNWTGLGALYFIIPPYFSHEESINNVCDVVDHGAWNEDLLRNTLPEDLAEHIMEYIQPPVEHNVLDKHIWILDTKGDFSMILALLTRTCG